MAATRKKDVIEVARCFTGWTVAPQKKGAGFEYNDKVHDKGQKVVLGHVIKAGGGMDDGLKVLEILAKQPIHGALHLPEARQAIRCRRSASVACPRMAKTFSRTDGDMRKVMQTMLQSPSSGPRVRIRRRSRRLSK